MTEAQPSPRIKFLRVIGVVWVAVISAFAIIDHVALSRSRAHVAAPSPWATEWPALQKRVAALERTQTTTEQQLGSLSEAKINASFDAIVQRVSPVEQALTHLASKEELAVVQEQLTAIDARLARTKAARARAAMPEVVVTAPRDPTPPFAVLGIELRGGERFLSVTSPAGSGLKDVRVLRIGDAVGEWRLEALQGRTAVFRNAGGLQRVEVP